MQLTTAILADPFAKQHDTGPGHPERPARFDAVMEGLSGFTLTEVEHRSANEDELAACHTRGYIRTVERDVFQGLADLSTGDTAIGHRSLDVALRGAGLVLNAVDLVVEGKAKNAFCAVRPPGHHATADKGMGFCLFNNVAVAARYAQRHHGLSRVLIADWDVHHGNGTQDIFYLDDSVFFFSTHQHPWYPGTGMSNETGEGRGEGATLNCPLPAGSGRDEILGAFRDRLLPAAETFRPDIVLLSAGFDSRSGDPLGNFLLSDRDFSDLTTVMMEIADKHCQGRLVSVLEGGYSLEGLSKGVKSHVETLAA